MLSSYPPLHLSLCCRLPYACVRHYAHTPVSVANQRGLIPARDRVYLDRYYAPYCAISDYKCARTFTYVQPTIVVPERRNLAVVNIQPNSRTVQSQDIRSSPIMWRSVFCNLIISCLKMSAPARSQRRLRRRSNTFHRIPLHARTLCQIREQCQVIYNRCWIESPQEA